MGDDPPPSNSAFDDDDEFGDFGEADDSASASFQPFPAITTAAAAAPPQTASTPAATSQPAAAAAPPPTADVSAAAIPPPAAAAVSPPQAPDILQLEGQQFLNAVLDAWQVFGARQEFEAAAAAATCAGSPAAYSAASACGMQGADTILACNGLPMSTGFTSNSGSQRMMGGGGFQPSVVCPYTLDWRGTPLEARLVESLGLTAAVAKEAAAAKGS